MNRSIILGLAAGLVSAGIASAAVTVSHKTDSGTFKRVEIRLLNEPIISNNATSGVGFATLDTGWKFEQGHQTIIGAVADLKMTFTSAEPANGSGIDFAVGTAGTDDANVTDAGEANIIPSTGVDPFTNGVTQIAGVLASVVTVDGTAAAKGVHLNLLIDDADISGIATGTVSGVILITYTENGDK